MKTRAVIAHFDPQGVRSGNLNRLLDCIRPHVDSGVVVSAGMSTCDVDLVVGMGFDLIQRTNVGYDFMSYSVGMDTVLTAVGPDQILFCNDSIYITDAGLFQACLKAIIDSRDSAAFAVTSRQREEHGQSFCFKLRRCLYMAGEIREFFAHIRPQPTRRDVVFQYEFGLSRCIKNVGGKLGAIFDSGGVLDNPTHSLAGEIEARLGFVKYERLLRNPMRLVDSQRFLALATAARVPVPTRKAAPASSDAPAIAICHCHYPEVIDELVTALDRLPDQTELYVTSSDPMVLEMFPAKWRRKGIKLRLRAVENRGRDVLPFLEVLRAIDIRDNTPVLKIHGKQSPQLPFGTRWRRDLLRGLLPSEVKIWEFITAFQTNPRLGILGSPGAYVSNQRYWGENHQTVADLIDRIRQQKIVAEDLGFFAGTMFWIRARCMQELLPFIEADRFEREEGQRDPTFAHALERAIPMLVRSGGWELYETTGETPVDPDASRNVILAYL